MEKVRLGDVGVIITGNTPKTSEVENYSSNDICFVKPSDIFEHGITNIETTEFYISENARNKARILPTNSVLVTCIGIIGKVAINKRECAFNQQINAIIPNLSKCVPQYLAYAILNQKRRIQDIANAPVVPIINKTQFSDIVIELAPINEQKQILSVLDKVTDLIEKRRVQLKKLDELIKSRFTELFGVEEYPLVLFEDACEFLRNGANIKQTKGARGYPITRIETLANDMFNTERLGYADIIDLSKYEDYLLHRGDILISHINSVAYLGRAVQYKGQLDTPVIHGMNLLCARINIKFNSTYIEWFFKTQKAKKYISAITKKAVNQASVTTSDLKKMPLLKPPLEKQNQFAEFVEQVDKSKDKVKKSLEKLELLKKALMQKYFG